MSGLGGGRSVTRKALVSRRVSTITFVLAALALSASLGFAEAAELPPRLKVGEQVLIQNGSGARSKNLLQLYVAGLYLPQKSSRADAIIAADSPMAIRIEITSIFVSQETFVAALNEGLSNSTGGNTAPIQKEIDAFRRCFAGGISKGDVFDIVYLPTTGVFVAKNGANQGVVPGLEFKKAIFGVWLSNKPADESLKRALLGK
jgi:hypothetical protein